jgi:hypothetical protein
MKTRKDRPRLHLARDRRPVVDPHIVSLLEAGTLNSLRQKLTARPPQPPRARTTPETG